MYVILKSQEWGEVKDIVLIYRCEYCEVELSYTRPAWNEPQSNQASVKYNFIVLPVCISAVTSSVVFQYRRKFCKDSEWINWLRWVHTSITGLLTDDKPCQWKNWRSHNIFSQGVQSVQKVISTRSCLQYNAVTSLISGNKLLRHECLRRHHTANITMEWVNYTRYVCKEM